MLGGSVIDLDGVPLFWLELFDHRTNMSVDSYRCHALKDAAPVFNLRFCQMMLNGGTLDGRRYLSPTTIKLMDSDHLGNRPGSRPVPF